MKQFTIHSILLVLIFAYSGNAQEQDWAEFKWYKTIEAKDYGSIFNVCTDKDGYVYALLHYSSTTNAKIDTFTLPPTLQFRYRGAVVKMDSLGKILWVYHTKGLGSVIFNQIEPDNFGNLYITGNFHGSIVFDNDTITAKNGFSYPQNIPGDGLIFKLDTSGKFQWVDKQQLVTHQDMVIDKYSGVVHLVSSRRDSSIFGSTHYYGAGNGLYSRFSPYGQILHLSDFADSGFAVATKMIINDNSELFFTGGYANAAKFGNVTLTNQNNNSVYNNIFIAKKSALGNFEWVNTFEIIDSSISYVQCHGLIYDHTTNNITAVGQFKDTVKFGGNTLQSYPAGKANTFLSLLDPQGNFIYSDHIKGGHNYMRDALHNDSGYIYLIGTFVDTVIFGKDTLIANNADVFFSKLQFANELLDFKWTIKSNGNAQESGNRIVKNHTNDIFYLVCSYGKNEEAKFQHFTFPPYTQNFWNSRGILFRVDELYLSDIHTPSFFKSVNVYPNPSSKVLNIELLPQNCRIQIVDILGKTIHTSQNKNETSINISVEGLNEGTYFLKINKDGEQLVKKISILQ